MDLVNSDAQADGGKELNLVEAQSAHLSSEIEKENKDSESQTRHREKEAIQLDPEIEKRVVLKTDWNLTSLVAWIFLLSFLDRSNIGNAEIAGMKTDLKLGNGSRYPWLLTIFYIGYITFQFQAFMWKVMPPHIWATIIVFIWGLLATCQAGVQSWAGEMVIRFLLGASEAGFGPSIPYLLSFFYLRHELGFRCGLFLAAAPLASTFAGALAYGITSGHPKLAKWRLLFLIEGIPTLLMVPVTYFCFPDSPNHARFLSKEEKVVAAARALRQNGKEESGHSISLKDIGLTLVDLKAWLTALMYFSCNVSYSSLPVFLPTILEELGFTAINAQGLSAPPYFVSFIVTIATSFLADRLQQRGATIIALSVVGAVGYVILATTDSVGARYFATFLAASGVFPAIANILPWVVNNQGSDTRRGMGIVILNTVGQCGPLLGTRVYPTKTAPRFVKGHATCAGFMFFNALLAFGLRSLLWWENKKLDKKYGKLNAKEQYGTSTSHDENVGEENYGPRFRYIL